MVEEKKEKESRKKNSICERFSEKILIEFFVFFSVCLPMLLDDVSEWKCNYQTIMNSKFLFTLEKHVGVGSFYNVGVAVKKSMGKKAQKIKVREN